MLLYVSQLRDNGIFEPTIKNTCKKLHINRQNIVYRVFQSIKMTCFVFVGELFFRAPSIKVGFKMLGKIFTSFNLHNTLKTNQLFILGLDIKDYLIIIVALIVIFIIGLVLIILSRKQDKYNKEVN